MKYLRWFLAIAPIVLMFDIAHSMARMKPPVNALTWKIFFLSAIVVAISAAVKLYPEWSVFISEKVSSKLAPISHLATFPKHSAMIEMVRESLFSEPLAVSERADILIDGGTENARGFSTRTFQNSHGKAVYHLEKTPSKSKIKETIWWGTDNDGVLLKIIFDKNQVVEWRENGERFSRRRPKEDVLAARTVLNELFRVAGADLEAILGPLDS